MEENNRDKKLKGIGGGALILCYLIDNWIFMGSI